MRASKLIRTAEFGDILGLFVWIFLAVVSISSFTTREPLNLLTNSAILVISICGLIVDGTMVYLRFIKRK